MSFFRQRLSYANVVATAALFIALGGGAYAANLANNSVKSKHIADGQVKTPDLANGAVKPPKLAPNAVTGDKVLDDSLTGDDIDEGTLGKVGDADTLDGNDSIDFLGASAKAADSDRLDGKDSGDFALAGSESWKALSLYSNTSFCNYANYGGGFNPAGYFRDRAGVVHLRGLIKAADGTSSACGVHAVDPIINGLNLPSGYRPANTELFTISANNKPGRIDVRSNGDIALEPNYPTWTDAKAWFSLDGISYRCAPSGQNGCP